MSDFISESYLASNAKAYVDMSNMVSSHFKARLTIFLSHSHKDKSLVEGFQKLLAKVGIKVYLDWQDSSMPRVTSRETAIKVKDRIKELNLFIFFLTENSVDSRWCPWELGIADGHKSYDDILILPVKNLKGEVKGSEYLSVYKKIKLYEGELNIFSPSYEHYPDDGSLKEFLVKKTKAYV